MNKIKLSLLLLAVSLGLKAQENSPLYLDSLQMKWVDEQYEALSLDEKVGQLFVVATYSNRDEAHYAEIEKLVKNEGIGGLIFMQDVAEKQIELTNRYNASAKIPLLLGMDGEWGLAMRLKEVERYPWALTIGAIQNDELVEQMGRLIGEQVARMGVGFNFAPAVDVNTNPLNPIIGNRSYGSDVDNVSRKGIAYMQGMKAMGVMASAKHFPGHGDTAQDSHHVTPVVPHDLARLKEVELAPFNQLINAEVAAVMVSHLSVPALDDSGLPATISKKIITDLLKGEMNFKGLVITDALNMKGITNLYSPGEIDFLAFEAGNDILLFSEDVKTGKQKIIEKIKSGEIPESRLEESVKKILMAKYWVGLNEPKAINPQYILEDLNQDKYGNFIHLLYAEAATLLKNQDDLLPISTTSNLKIAYVPLEDEDYEEFYHCLKNYARVDLVKINSIKELKKLKKYDLVIVGLHKSNETVYKPYKISENSQAIVKAISVKHKTVVSIFTSPYALLELPIENAQAIAVFYQNLENTHQVAADAIFGEIRFKGKLPVDVNESFKFGDGIQTNQ